MDEYKVLTSKGRKLPLPLKISDIAVNEEIVSTDAPHGMLFALEDPEKVLKSYFLVEESELLHGAVVCLPLFEDYKDQEKKKLLKRLETLEST